MAKQRYNTSIDSLSYAKSEVPYVAPPTKEILALLDSRENRYLKSKTNIDLAKFTQFIQPWPFIWLEGNWTNLCPHFLHIIVIFDLVPLYSFLAYE